MSDDGLVECRLCGRRWRSLGHHVRWGHGISADEYRDRFDIKRGEPLTSATTRALFQDAIEQTIASGQLAAHYAGNADRATAAAAAAAVAISALRAAGVDRFGAKPIGRDVIEAIVVAIEAGALVATAVKRSPVGYSTFHDGLRRHPDLKDRVEAAKRRRA